MGSGGALSVAMAMDLSPEECFAWTLLLLAFGFALALGFNVSLFCFVCLFFVFPECVSCLRGAVMVFTVFFSGVHLWQYHPIWTSCFIDTWPGFA